MSVKIVCLCIDCIYNEKASCARPGGIMIRDYVLGPMCESYEDKYEDEEGET